MRVAQSAKLRRMTTSALPIAAAQAQWQPETVYLNTASYGLPPRGAWDALQAALADWHHGRTSWEHWADSVQASREQFATLVGVGAERVAVGASVSGLVGLIAASVPDGARVLTVEGEFTSLIFPFMAQAVRGVTVELVPLARLVDAIDARTDVVAVSAVQSGSGELAPLAALTAAARAHGALTIVDGTQSCGWLPIDAAPLDALVCSGYKWLMSPRGSAFMALSERLGERIVPHAAGWFASEHVHDGYYGAPLRLAGSARRFDTSPAWHCWVGTAPALELINRIGVEAIRAHDVALANRFRAGIGLAPSDSAIVSASVAGAEPALARAGVIAAARAGRLRAAFHVYNREADVDAALAALA